MSGGARGGGTTDLLLQVSRSKYFGAAQIVFLKMADVCEGKEKEAQTSSKSWIIYAGRIFHLHERIKYRII